MSNIEEKIDKILELQVKQSTDIALIKQAQDIHISDYMGTKNSHYKLRDDFKGLKAKVILISSFIGGLFTLIVNFIYKLFTEHN